MAVLTSEQEPCCRKPTDPPAISLYPKPKVYQGRGQYFELLRSACHHVESAHKRCQEQGCILIPPFAKKQKGSFTIHTLRQEPVLQKAEVLHTQGTKQPAFSMQRRRTWCSPVRQVGDFLPAIPTDPSQLRSCSSSALNLQTILHEVEKSSQLLQQKWACLAEQTLVKKQSRNGGQRGFSCLQRQSQGGEATGASSENNWSKTQAHYCTKDPEVRQWILDAPTSSPTPFKRRKQQRHVQSHGHAFIEFQECPKEFQQKNTQFLHLNYIQSWPLLARQRHSQSWSAEEKGKNRVVKTGHWDLEALLSTACSDTTLNTPLPKKSTVKPFLDITGTLKTKLIQGLGLLANQVKDKIHTR